MSCKSIWNCAIMAAVGRQQGGQGRSPWEILQYTPYNSMGSALFEYSYASLVENGGYNH